MALARVGMSCPAGTFSQRVPGRCKDLVKQALTAADSAFSQSRAFCGAKTSATALCFYESVCSITGRRNQ